MLPSPYMSDVVRSGFTAVDSVVHLFVGGSELHGAKVGATDDLDLYGVFIGPPEDVLGLSPREHFVWSTANDERRNGPDDVDLTLYSLSKWAAMAAKGNATALHFLFAEKTATSSSIWSLIQDQKKVFLSKRSALQFLGFAENQLRRITGEKGKGAKGTRPEYECVFGYDTKAAMHTLRLLFECAELMTKGTITLPRPERELLIDVRSGSWSLERFLNEAESARIKAEKASVASWLPDAVNEMTISELVARTHLDYWKTLNQDRDRLLPHG